MSVSAIFPDEIALEQVKPGSRNLYKKAFNRLREFLGRDLEDSPPSEQDLINYFRDLRNEKKAASSTLWTTYSLINSVCKGKYIMDLKTFTRVSTEFVITLNHIASN